MLHHFYNGDMAHSAVPNIGTYVFHRERLNVDSQYFYINCISKPLYPEKKDVFLEQVCVDKQHNKLIFWDSINELFKIINNIGKTDVIIFHSSIAISFKLRIIVYLFLFLKGLLTNTILECWNGCDFDTEHIENKSKRAIVTNLLSFFYKRFRSVNLISLQDYHDYHNLYKRNGTLLPVLCKKNREIQRYSKFTKPFISVMVSHSGWEHNGHQKSFELLSKYKDENIRIVCPLCYGNKDYINSVIDEGERVFGDNFLFFTDLKPLLEYKDMINKDIDIYVTSADIQTGLFASNCSMLSGCRVFVGESNYLSYREMGIVVNSIEELSNMTFEEFIKPISTLQYDSNVRAYKSFYDNDVVIEKYKSLLYNK